MGSSDRHGSGPAAIPARDAGASSPGSVLTATAILGGTAVAVTMAPAAPVYTERDRHLPASAAVRIARAVPKNTSDNNRSRWRQFAAWCASDGRVAMPATAETLAAYLDHLATDKGLKASTLEAHASAVRVRHRAEGAPPPETLYARKVIVDRQHEMAEDADGESGPRKALPIVRADLPVIVGACDHTARGTRDKAVILLSWALMLRNDEAARLNRVDVTHMTGEGIRVRIRRSKTDNKGVDRYVPFAKDRTICPARATLAWMEMCQAEGAIGGALFRPVDRWDNIVGGAGASTIKREARLSTKSIYTIITERCEAVLDQLQHSDETTTGTPQHDVEQNAAVDVTAGVATTDATGRRKGPKTTAGVRRQVRRRRYTGHSARRGGATSLIKGGAPWRDVAHFGRWVPDSRSFYGYVEEGRAFDENPLNGML